MPTREAHERQATLNLEFSKEPVFESKNYIGWKIVVLFYETIHMIEAYLAEKNINPGNHKDRKDAIINDDIFGKKTFRTYKKLYYLSQKARYDCVVITGQDLAQALMYHDAIMKRLQNIMPNH